MKATALFYALGLILSSSCATLNVMDIKNLEKTEFDPLFLIPDSEVNNLRIDLIRQTYDEDINDSITETKETPYHPVGFNLGNGLFYDLRNNFCFRIDYLLDFSPDMEFEIEKTDIPDKKKGITKYSFTNDSLMVSYPPRRRINYRYHRIKNIDSTSYMHKNRLQYAISKTDSTLVYSGNRRILDVIFKVDDKNYHLNKKRWKDNYQIKDKDILLKDNYVVSLINGSSTIEIKRDRKNRKVIVLYTIERNDEKIFIYDNNYSGLLIELKGDSILLHRNKTLIRKYERKI